MSVKFEKQHYSFPTKLARGSANNIIEAKILEGADEIEAVEGECGCTTAVLAGDKIIISYVDQDTKASGYDVAQNRITYPEGAPFFKTVDVYLKDGRVRQLMSGAGGYYVNPEKEKIVLTFAGYVNLSE